jgi:hypothetical protein
MVRKEEVGLRKKESSGMILTLNRISGCAKCREIVA